MDRETERLETAVAIQKRAAEISARTGRPEVECILDAALELRREAAK